MKPTSNSNEAAHRSASFARRFPVIDCNYQASSYIDYSGGHCANVPTPSFRNISRDYFRDEARYAFFSEAAFFVLMTMTAGVAIASGAVAAIDFLRVLGYL
jgi:hypothetical protein